MQRFDQLDLDPITLAALERMNYATPTPIQAEAIPHLLNGRDVIAQARTGTGKTAAFGIPLVEASAADGTSGVLVLTLVPTRELAVQVAQELGRLAHGTKVRSIALYGGAGFEPQAAALRRGGPQIVVATPGRLLDHLERRTIRLDGVCALVLDEADRMLDMGFLPDVERILRTLPRNRLTALFTATLPEPIQRLARRFLRDAVTIRVEEGSAPPETIDQYRIHVAPNQKMQALQQLLEREAPARAIIFTRTKHRARSLARALERAGWAAVPLQGNMSQAQRDRSMAQFRAGQARLLVATDVASRGLDVSEVTHVINLDLPGETDAYVHRVGRTARMGRAGRAFTFVQPDQVRDARRIEAAARVQMKDYDVGPLSTAPPGPRQDRPDEARSPPSRRGPRRRPQRFTYESSAPRRAHPRAPTPSVWGAT